ncbi:MAG: ATP-binding cassette domain-containing protein [Alphaproteobacteria bacterium]|nr:ATP-binding cassette domain-containing protein [Alphaproteobacteria bacterium]
MRALARTVHGSPVTFPVLELKAVSKRFPLPRPAPWVRREYVRAVSSVDLTVAKGETVGLVGESGSGKTTVALLAIRALAPSEGHILFQGHDISTLSRRALKPYRRRMQLVFQDPYASLNPRLTVGDTLMEPLVIHGLASSAAAGRQRVAELLDLVNLPASAAERYPHEFSGGQRQRIGIARALAVEPDLLIADEPVSALDVSVQAQIIALLETLRQKFALSLLLVSHDLGVVGYVCETVVVMYLGRVMEMGPTGRLYEAPKHPYTEALLSAIPAVEDTHQRERIVLKGEAPSPISPPSGCVFRTRCRYAQPACADAVPELRPVGDGRAKACIRDDIL